MRSATLNMLAALALLALPALAAPRITFLSLSTGTNDTATTSTTAISGYLDEIVLELPSGAVTGTVAVTATPIIGAAVTVASRGISATHLVRPRFDGTDTAGTALTNDPPGRYMIAADKITITVSGASPTGLTWRVGIKWDDGKP